MTANAPQREIVLLGAGHNHLHVLRMWGQAPIPGARLTCVTDLLSAAYPDMLSGTLAGMYSADEMRIDLVRLCAAGNIRLIRANVSGLDHQRRELQCEHGPPISFDVLSIGIGSVPREAGVLLDESVVRLKPKQTFLRRLDERLAQFAASEGDNRPLRIAVIGDDVRGVEISLCLPVRLRQALGSRPFELSLIDSDVRLLPDMGRAPSNFASRALRRCNVQVILGRAVRSATAGLLTLDDDSQIPADLVLWCTGAEAPPLLAKLGLPTDHAGFLSTRSTLQSLGDERIFAVGDHGTIQGRPAPKAGVYALRQGPILWGNLHRTHFNRPLIRYQPQRGFLSLMDLADGRAILSYRGLAASGRWCWRLKDSIDRRFVQQFRE